jgi:uncharacterized repeat protein (TIGR01451 family)
VLEWHGDQRDRHGDGGLAGSERRNNSASTTTNVIAVADLVSPDRLGRPQVLINVPVTFTATSSNNGPSDAQNVSVTLTLTPDFRYSSHTATGATCTTPQIGNTGAIVCTWAGATAPGATRTLTVVAYSNNEGNTAVNASTTSATTDPVPNNNAGSVSRGGRLPVQRDPDAEPVRAWCCWACWWA